MVHEMLRKSPIPAGERHFGMTVTNSCFHSVGQTEVLVISLKTSVRGMARRSPNLDIKAGKISPRTMDFGFLKARILPATWKGRSRGRFFVKVRGIWSGSRGLNSWLILLKKPASSSATSLSPLPGKRDLTSNCGGRSLAWNALTFLK